MNVGFTTQQSAQSRSLASKSNQQPAFGNLVISAEGPAIESVSKLLAQIKPDWQGPSGANAEKAYNSIGLSSEKEEIAVEDQLKKLGAKVFITGSDTSQKIADAYKWFKGLEW